jgi:hypothetical protein
MRKIAPYFIGLLGALTALFSSGFYLLFTETVQVKEFWIGLFLFLLALFGAASIFFIHKRPVFARRNFFIAGIGGILGLLFLAGFSSSVFDGTFLSRPALFYFSGYFLFFLAGLTVKK